MSLEHWEVCVDESIRQNLNCILVPDRQAQGQAYQALLAATETTVDWAYEAWDELVNGLRHPDNHVRSIAAQLLCNLAISDPQERIYAVFPALIEVTRDERFVTARHCLLSLWKVGLAGEGQRKLVVAGLCSRFADCSSEKNAALIRSDILQGLKKLHDRLPEGLARNDIRAQAQNLVKSELDEKLRKKYAGVWKFQA